MESVRRWVIETENSESAQEPFVVMVENVRTRAAYVDHGEGADTTTCPESQAVSDRKVRTPAQYSRRARRPREARARPVFEDRLNDLCELLRGWLWEMGDDLRFTYFSERRKACR